jgi:hypothetical protein
MNGLFVLLLFFGFIVFGIAIQHSHVFPPWSGILIATGWSLLTICAPLALFIFEPLWILAVLGTLILGTLIVWRRTQRSEPGIFHLQRLCPTQYDPK